jgi:hypothetical protein
VWARVAQLGEDQRECIVLRFARELLGSQTAAAVQCSLNVLRPTTCGEGGATRPRSVERAPSTPGRPPE